MTIRCPAIPFRSLCGRALLAAALVTFLTVAAGQARASMIYTFTGTITAIGDNAGITAAAGLMFGDSITYVVEIDPSGAGSFERNNGTLVLLSDTASFDYFFADYVSGDAIFQKDGGVNNASTDIAENNYGQNRLSGAGSRSSVFLNSGDDLLTFSQSSLFVSQWTVGTTFSSSNQAFDSTGQSSGIFSNDLTLVSIVQVPEPSPALLLAVGLAGLAGGRRWL